MLPDKKVMCHHTGFQTSCFDGVVQHNCRKWFQIRGSNPQTGEPIDQWACVDSLMPMLMIENSQQQRQTAAAVESFRNEVAIANRDIATKMIGVDNE